MRFGELRASLWLSVARCVARSVIVVAGKFASILICGLAAELRIRNSQPQSVLRFCVFGGQGFFGFQKQKRVTFIFSETFVALWNHLSFNMDKFSWSATRNARIS